MNKTAKIIIGILILVCGFLIVFAKIQVNDVEKQAVMILKLKSSAKLKEQRAIELAAYATKAQNEAERAMSQLQECKASK